MEKNESLPAIVEFETEKAVDRIKEAIKFADSLREILKSGEDYNKHPGYQKPALEKPGAEKIAFALNCGPQILRGEEGKIIDEQYGLKEFNLVVGLVNRSTGLSYGEGVGYGRATEKDLYAWDDEKRARILKPERIEWANNTALKMAFKSALICASLSVGSLSGYFTQDLDKAPPKEPKKDKKPEPLFISGEEKEQFKSKVFDYIDSLELNYVTEEVFQKFYNFLVLSMKVAVKQGITKDAAEQVISDIEPIFNAFRKSRYWKEVEE